MLVIASLLVHVRSPLVCQTVSAFDVLLLSGLVAPAQQQDQHLAVLEVVHPTSSRSSDTPLPTGLTSPGLPFASRSMRFKMRRRPARSLSFVIQSSKSSVRTTSTMCRLYLTDQRGARQGS